MTLRPTARSFGHCTFRSCSADNKTLFQCPPPPPPAPGARPTPGAPLVSAVSTTIRLAAPSAHSTGVSFVCGVDHCGGREPQVLRCPGGKYGKISKVAAFFGTPDGNCTAGFANGTCNAPSATAIVQELCAGKANW